MKLFWNKRKCLDKTRVQLQHSWFGRRFIVLKNQYGCRDVNVKTLFRVLCYTLLTCETCTGKIRQSNFLYYVINRVRNQVRQDGHFLSPDQTSLQVVASSGKLNSRRDLRWVAKRTGKFPHKHTQVAKNPFQG